MHHLGDRARIELDPDDLRLDLRGVLDDVTWAVLENLGIERAARDDDGGEGSGP